MASIEILQYDLSQSEGDDAARASKAARNQEAVASLRDSKSSQDFTFGVGVQDEGLVQLTGNAPMDDAIIEHLHKIYGNPRSRFEVSLNRAAVGTGGLATNNVVEYVQNFFPASRATPEFRKQIEDDFLQFEKIYKDCARGGTEAAFGWVEDQEHDDINGEKATVFLIARGWESMALFEDTLKQPAYAKAIPILLAWKALFKMWHVERKFSGVLRN